MPSNTNSPYGLKPVRHMSGGEICSNAYPITASTAGAIYKGDPVIGVSDGSITVATDGAAACMGVFSGCEYDDVSGQHHFSPNWPALTTATNVVGYVYDDPNIIYQIQSDATGVALGDINQAADYDVVAGSSLTGVSATNLDCSAGLGSTDKNLRILRLVNDGVNAAGAYAQVEVVFSEHAFKGVVAGVGGV